VCRLELIVDADTQKMIVAPFAAPADPQRKPARPR
jgi:hypothetical protein